MFSRYFTAIVPALLFGCASSFEGTWKTNCLSGEIETITISNGEIERSSVYYKNNDCTTEHVKYTVKNTFELTVSSDTIDGAYNIGSKLIYFKITPLSTSAVVAYQPDKTCGITLAINTATDITGLDCATLKGPTAGHITYNVIKLEEKDSKKYILLGDSSGSYDAQSETSRPISLDEQRVYYKQ